MNDDEVVPIYNKLDNWIMIANKLTVYFFLSATIVNDEKLWNLDKALGNIRSQARNMHGLEDSAIGSTDFLVNDIVAVMDQNIHVKDNSNRTINNLLDMIHKIHPEKQVNNNNNNNNNIDLEEVYPLTADHQNPISEYEENYILIYTSFPWLFPSGIYYV